MSPLVNSIVCCLNKISSRRFSSTATSNGGLEWLNDVCVEFEKCCHLLHSHLASGLVANSVRDGCLLCITQIVGCIRCLERTIKAESSRGILLEATQKLFLDRVSWCFTKLTESTSTIPDINIKPAPYADTSNFVAAMDTALDLIGPLTMFTDDAQQATTIDRCDGVAARRTKDYANHIRAVINALIGHALSFANLAQPDDRRPLSTVCQSLLRECMAFEQRMASSMRSDDDSQCQLSATRVENALYQLDGLVNDSLLRLVYAVFVEMAAKPLNVLAELIECDADEAEVDNQIAHFDEVADRLQQIGIFAAAFAPNLSEQTAIRSALASFEALEPALIPALLARNSLHHAALLSQHWTDESTRLITTVQRIIDSHAFCVCLCEHIASAVDQLQRQYERRRAVTVLAHCAIFQDHLRHNWTDVVAINETAVRHANNFELMHSECRAAVDACGEGDQIEWAPRVIKRFRILLGVLKKLGTTLNDNSSKCNESGADFTFGNVTPPNSRRCVDMAPSRIVVPVDSLAAFGDIEAEAFFESFGIARSRKSSILYAKSPLVDRKWKLLVSPEMATTAKRPLPRKPSLRSGLFKRAVPMPCTASTVANQSTMSSAIDDQSFDLQITNILEQLTDLSTTLSNGLSTT